MTRFFILGLFFTLAYTLRSQPALSLLAHLPYDSVTLAGCWHHVDNTGREYALVGTSRGLSIVDLSNPAQPFQRFYVPSVWSNWREVKTWGGFAYFGSEGSNSAITIVDLRELPDTIRWKVWRGDGEYENQIYYSHTVQAENGYLYVFGGGNATNGATICDLSDPWNPHIVGLYTTNYVHDGFIRGDTLWTSEIYKGQFGVVDISDKSNPVLLTTHPTPFIFNHNSWLSDNSKILFTTDEKTDAPLAAFDVSDLENIKLLDKYYPSFNPSKEVHNVRVLNDYLINPSYGGQLTIVDAHRPENLVETARALMGTSLVWDADPYLPSGIIFATAKAEGLFIYMPDYQRAAYLEGHIADELTGADIKGGKVKITDINLLDSTDVYGLYKTGTVQAGTYVVSVEKTGYFSKIIQGITLQKGQVTALDVQLTPMPQSVQEKGGVEGPFRVYPTIFSDKIHVECLAGNWPEWENAFVQLIDNHGNVLINKTMNDDGSIDLFPGYLPASTYGVRITNQFGNTRSIIVVKL